MSSEDERYDLLIGFLEGELDDDERERVEGELAGPSDAQDRLEAYRGLGAALAELEPPAPSAEARDRAYAAVMAAMAADSAAAPVEASLEPAEATLVRGTAGQAGQGAEGAAAPRGQLLRFLSASAAAALVMVSALFYLGGLETPGSNMALAPKKVANERSAPLPAAGQATLDAEAGKARAAGPQPEAAGFTETMAPKAEAFDEELAKEKDLARVLEQVERERAAVAKNWEGGAARAKAAELLEPSPTGGVSTPATSVDDDPASPPKAPPAEPQAETPEVKAFGGQRRPQDSDRSDGTSATPADAPGSVGGEPSEGARPGRKKVRGDQRGARRQEAPPAPRPRRSMGREPEPAQPDADGALPQGPEADSSAGEGGGGAAPGRVAPRSGGEARDDEQATKGKTLAGKPGQGAGRPSEAPRAGRSEAGFAEDGFREEEAGGFQRFRRLEAAPKELQPAWIVTRGQERVLYVMEGTKLTQAPFPELELRDQAAAKANKNAEPRAEALQVTALKVQRRALATQRKSVDLRVLERREDLLAIAKLELASEAKTRGARVDEPDARPDSSRPGGPGASAGKKGGQADSSAPETGSSGRGTPELGKTAQKEGEPKDGLAEAEVERADAPGAQADGKRPLPAPAPAAGRDRAELLLRLLGAIEAPRPSRTELLRAVDEAERRHVKARRRR